MTPKELSRLLSGAAEVIPQDGLKEKLALGRPLRVKLGIDPSRPDLTLGHAVVLRKLRQFQESGHAAVLIIGDFTGRVGDPSGQSETRPFLSEEEIDSNARTYLDQAALVLDVDTAEIRRNSEWLGSMDMEDVLKLTSAYTVARMLERDDFRSRYREGRAISLVEFLYPLMQAMDSVAIEADVELGGTDQTFNLLVGREIQREYGQEPQVVFTMPLLMGTDGQRKMSKSFDNYVGLTEPSDDMFGKLMRIPDELITTYLRLCTDLDPSEVLEIEGGLAAGKLHPAHEKRLMAREVVSMYHGEEAAAAAAAEFDRVHRDRELPELVPEVATPTEPVVLPVLLARHGLAASNSDGRRLVVSGAVRLGGVVRKDPWQEFTPAELRGQVLQVGRRRFVRLT